MKFSLYTISYLIVIFFLYLSCGISTGVVSGGSSTETIGGTLVDTLGVPVSNVLVEIDTVNASDLINSNIYFTSTNIDGEYKIVNIKSGVYKLTGVNKDSSLVIFINKINYEDEDSVLNLGIDTMRSYGKIFGIVLLDGIGVSGVDVYIHGSSYISKSDGDGKFLIDKVPSGNYVLGYQYAGFSEYTDSSVNVISSETTVLESVNLTISIKDAPPTPLYFCAIYDTAIGVANFSWQGANVSDLAGYNIFRKNSISTDSTFVKIEASIITDCYSDTLFKNSLDTSVKNYKYKISAIDTLGNESSYSTIIDVNCAPPHMVKTVVNWTKHPILDDTVTIGDTIMIVIEYTNKTRNNILLHWFIGDPIDTVRTCYLSQKNGCDTLVYMCQDTGNIQMAVEFTDERGMRWLDSCTVSVTGINPSNRWEYSTPILHARRQGGIGVVDDKLFIIGGVEDIYIGLDWKAKTLSSVEINLGIDNPWEALNTMPSSRDEMATVVLGKNIFVIGGRNFNDYEFSTMEIFDTDTYGWKRVVDMWSMRFSTAACAIGDTIFVLGGIRKVDGNYERCDSIYSFNTVTNNWSYRGKMKTARAGHSATVFNGKIYILGGYTNPNIPTPISSVECFDPMTNISCAILDMSHPRMNFGAVALNGKIYAVGGISVAYPREVLASVEAYDTNLKTWISKKDLPKPRHSFAISVFNNKIIVIGGSDEYYADPRHVGQTNTVLKYYP